MKLLTAHVGLLFAIAFIALVALVGGRTVCEARSELDVARSHREAGRPAAALEHYRRSLRWSFPFTPYVDEAVVGLESIAREAERTGDESTALLAWRSLAGGLAASRFAHAPRSPARDRANAEIARLLSTGSIPTIDANRDTDALAAEHRRLLEREASPDPIWGTVLLLGFFVWIGSLIWLAQRGFDSSGRLEWARARGPLWSALASFATFVLGLLFA